MHEANLKVRGLPVVTSLDSEEWNFSQILQLLPWKYKLLLEVFKLE